MSSIKNRENPNDKIYTPPKVVDLMIEFSGYKHGDHVLEPAKGLGAIYDKLKSPKEYCEIEEDKDYFNYDKKVEWVITNPPYSLIDAFLKHTYTLCNKFCFLIGCEKLDNEPDNIIFKSVNLGNKCLYCNHPCGGMRGKNIKHCKRKSNENECRYF